MIRFDSPYILCPLCSSEEIEFSHNFHYKNIPLSIYVCSECSFQFMNPSLSDASIASLYSDEYYAGEADYSYTDERKSEQFSRHVWDARIRTIRRWVKEGNFLDIGCSFGGFLSRASRYFTPYGIEISPYSASYAQECGITVHTGSLNDTPFDENFFSVITMIEVIEHLKDPLKTASYCYSRLKQGGIAVIQTADMNAHQARRAGKSYHYYLPGHVSYYSEENLRLLLLQTGFKKIKVYRPVDFGLLPKLKKMRGNFTTIADYRRWIGTSLYHISGHFKKEGIPLTSSMVLYAQK